MAEHGIDPVPMEPIMEQLEEEAKTVMLVAVGGVLAGVVAVADTLRRVEIRPAYARETPTYPVQVPRSDG